MNMDIKERITSIISFIACIIGIIISKKLPSGPNVFPLGIFILGSIFSIILFLSSFSYKKEFRKETDKEINIKRVFSTIFLSFIYFLLIKPIGYIIVTPIFLFVMIYIVLGYKRLYVSFFYSVGFSALFFLIFKILLKVPLPKGGLF